MNVIAQVQKLVSGIYKATEQAISIGDPTTAANKAKVTDATPGASDFGIVVRSISDGPVAENEYRAATDLIVGSVAAQVLSTLHNPAASGVTIKVKRCFVQGTISAVSATAFLYHLKRTTAAPTDGTLLTAQERRLADPASVAVARQSPTATGAAGDLWVSSPGTITGALVGSSAVGAQGTIRDAILAPENVSDIILEEDEAVGFFADANTVDWRHYVVWHWTEV